MELSKEDVLGIKASYRDAKDKTEQLHILSELYLQSVDKIAEICGVESSMKNAGMKTANVGLVKSRNPRKSYSQAARDDVCKAVILDRLSADQAAEKFGIPKGNVGRWVAAARKQQACVLEFADDVAANPLPDEAAISIVNDDDSKSTQNHVCCEPTNSVMSRIDEGVNHLSLGLACLLDLGILPEELPTLIGELRIKAEGFRAGIAYALLQSK